MRHARHFEECSNIEDIFSLHTKFKEIGHRQFSTLALLAIGNIVDFASIIVVRAKEKIITIEKPNSTVENKQ